ncbi:hypothetical protein [Parasitella parasitica]|uniref:FAR1 domain-containing protein n=1 Tax=Parasitella parasitica TaxID=35722 RepID=A0A0B7MYJ4_9FUNG|nr:hypothetical protein [Parasitella parasitica]
MSESSDNTAQTLYEQGKLAFDNGEYESSIAKLGEACQDKLNGDLAPANGDAYFLYGQALLQYAIQQNTVLGQSAQASATHVEQQQEAAKEEEGGMRQQGLIADHVIDFASFVESKNPLFQLSGVPKFKQANDEDEEEDAEEEEEEQEAGNTAEEDFEAAWDILDVARLIFEKGEDEKLKLKLADVHLCLGDVSLETGDITHLEKFDGALPDYEKAIEIKQSILQDDSRELAEAHYKFALALEFSTERADQALSELQKAVDVLKKRISNLEMGQGKGKGKATDLDQKTLDEIKDINELIPDMELKIEELATRQATENEAMAMLKTMFGFTKASTELTASTPVNDISTLIRRKPVNDVSASQVMSEQVKSEIIEVKSQPTEVAGLSEAAANLSNALEQTTATTSTTVDYTQQTLMDVNSQPLMQSLMENGSHHPLLSHSSITDPTELMNVGAAMFSQIVNSNGGVAPPTITAADLRNNRNCSIEITGNTLDPSSPIITEFYDKFAVGRMFQTLDELRNEAFEYGKKHNVALTTSKSDKTKIYLICKHGGQYRKNNKRPVPGKNVKPRIRSSHKIGCPCMIYARCCRGSFWVVRKCVGEHNHPIAEDPRTYSMYRCLSDEHLLVVRRLLREHVGNSFIVKALKANGVTNILVKDIENIQQDLKRRGVLDLPPEEDQAFSVGLSSEQASSDLVAPLTDTSIVATISANPPAVIVPNTTDDGQSQLASKSN